MKSLSFRRPPAAVAVAVFVGLAATAWVVAKAPAAMTAWLYDAEPPVSSDLIVVLSGGSRERVETALDLYRRGMAPAIMITDGDGYPDALMRYLEAEGVPGRALAPPPRPSHSTWQDALAVRDAMLRRGAGSVLVVTSPYHCRRARLILKRVLADLPVRVTVAGSKSLYMNPARWWRSRQGWITVAPEFPKLIWAIATVPAVLEFEISGGPDVTGSS